ncbi:hypothetical protein GCM10010206_29100 [Streptomyces cinerochromogenes]|nr:hypothetical protein GCM10010206_29100 [Streptomyces cinerochromogenes]
MVVWGLRAGGVGESAPAPWGQVEPPTAEATAAGSGEASGPSGWACGGVPWAPPPHNAPPSTARSAAPGHAKGPVVHSDDRPFRRRGDRPGDYRRCWLSATVTSTRWNSFSSL